MREKDDFFRDVADRVERVFRIAAHRDGITGRVIEAETGISLSNQAEYRKGAAIPLHNALRLMKLLPGDLASLLIEPSGWAAKANKPEAEDWLGVAAETCRLDAEIIEAESSGMSPQKVANLKDHARVVIAKLQGVVE